MTRRVMLIAGAFALAVAVAVISTWLYIGRRGTTELENWIGRQIVGILENHLNPRVSFDNLDYQAPRTVVVENLTLTAQDRPILQMAWARLELAEIPQRGKPILVQRIELNTPQLRFINTADDRLVGWSDFIKTEAVEHPETVPTGQRLSDVLVLRHVGIEDGQVVYEDETNTVDRMTLPGINLRLDTPPDEQNPGWHQLAGRLQRDPIIDLQLKGRINLDTGLLDIAQLQLAASLGERQYETLPPALQKFLRRHEVQGALTATGQGQIPLGNPAQTSGTFQAQLLDARVRYAGMVLPIEAIKVDARLPDGNIGMEVAGVKLAQNGNPFFSMDALRVRLAGIPEADQPLIIEQVQVERPHFVFASRPRDGAKGWSELAELSEERGTADTDAGEILRAVHLRQFELQDGAVTYQPAGGEPLTLGDINVSLNSKPQPDAPDLLDLAGTLEAGGLLTAQLAGNIDTREARVTIEKFKAGAEVHPDQQDQLPAKAREWVARHEFQGRIAAGAEGTISLNELRQSTLTADVELASARMKYNGVAIPLGEARVQFRLPQGRIEASASDLSFTTGDEPFFAFKQMTASLLMPAEGSLVLDHLLLDQPAVTLAAGAEGGFAGWNRLFPASEPAKDTRTDAQPATDEASGDLLPFALREAQIRGGSFAYAADPDAQPLRLAGIDLALTPTDKDSADLLNLTGSVSDAWIQAQLAGQLDVPAKSLKIDQFQANTNINADAYDRLPPALQEMVTSIQFTGEVGITASGTVPLNNASAARGELQADIRSASFGRAGLAVPLKQARVSITLPDGPFSLDAQDIAVRDGESTLAQADTLSLQSGRLPWLSDRMHLSRLRLERPVFNFTQQADGTLAGWSRPGEPADAAGPASPAPAQQQGLLERFALDRVELANATVNYRGRTTNGPLVVQGVDAVVTSETDPSSVLKFSGQIRQPLMLSAEFEGQYDEARSLLTFSKLAAKATLRDATLANLPPPMQESFRRNPYRGEWQATWQGTIPLDGNDAAKGRLDVSARDASFAYAGLGWPVAALQVQADLPNGPVAARGKDLAVTAGELQILSVADFNARIARLAGDQGPLRIESIELQSPQARLLAQKEGFVGWSRLLDAEEEKEPRPRSTPRPAPRDPEPRKQPGLIIDRLRVRNGELIYASAPGRNVMALPGIDLDVRMEPPNAEAYAITGQIKRPFLDMDLNGRYHAADELLDLQSLKLRAQVSEQQYQALPPSVQEIIREHAVRGTFNLEAQGHIPLHDPSRLRGRLAANARDVHFRYGETRWPIQTLDLNAQADRGNVEARLNAALLGGKLQADARAALPNQGAFDLNWQVSEAQLEELMGAVQGQESTYAGVVNSQGKATGRLDELPQSLSGSGELTVTNGRLMRLPIIQGVIGRLVSEPLGLGPGRQDRAEVKWQFRPDHLALSQLDVASPLIALQGKGQIFYDDRVDLRFTAQLLQAVPNVLGDIGTLMKDIGNLGGRIVSYNVTGTLEEPRVVPVPLGGIGGR